MFNYVIFSICFIFVTAQQFKNVTKSHFDKLNLQDFWTGAAFVDIDQDGDDDLIVTDRVPGQIPKKSRVYQNNKGKFTYLKDHAISQELGFWFGLTSGDYNNDGLIDIYIAGYHGALFKNIGNGNYERINDGVFVDRTLSGICAGFSDFDNDGDLDLIITRPEWIPGAPWHGQPGSPRILKNSGAPDYKFNEVKDVSISESGKDTYMHATIFDFDDDLDMDIFIGMGSGVSKTDKMFRNEGKDQSYSFSKMTDNIISKALVEGNQWSFIDVDNDGDWDVHVTNWATVDKGTNYPRNNFLFKNNGDDYDLVKNSDIYTDQDMTTTSLWGDFDNDADIDMISVSDSGYTLKYYDNDGRGHFTRKHVGELSNTNLHQSGGSVSDIDQDGDLDVFIPGPRSNSTLFRNDLENDFNWVKFKLIGTSSNRSAIGAQLTLTIELDGEEIKQRRNITVTDVFFGHQSLTQHFGLNKAKKIKSLVIRWPSGEVSKMENLKVNRIHDIKE